MSTILIVDDEFSVRSLLRDVLELEDYEVRRPRTARPRCSTCGAAAPTSCSST